MKYREKLIQLIKADDKEALFGWIQSHDGLDQTAILREFKIVLTELAEKEGYGLGIYGDTFDDFDEKIDKFEDAILDVKFTKAQLKMIEEDKEVVEKRINEGIEANRAYIIDCIVNNRPNAVEMRQLADDLIAFEKKTNTYQYENWEPIFLL